MFSPCHSAFLKQMSVTLNEFPQILKKEKKKQPFVVRETKRFIKVNKNMFAPLSKKPLRFLPHPDSLPAPQVFE